jgi:hypothetical protein
MVRQGIRPSWLSPPHLGAAMATLQEEKTGLIAFAINSFHVLIFKSP